MPNISRTVNTQDFARRLERIMRVRGLTPYQVATRMSNGHKQPYRGIYDWLKGRHKPRDGRLAQLAKVLGVQPCILLGRHTLVFSGLATGEIRASCEDCDRGYTLDGNRHIDEELTRFQHHHWGIEC